MGVHLDGSRGVGVSRLEVVEGPSGRRQRTKAERARIVEPPRKPARNRGHLPPHLPRIERVIEPASPQCPCGCGEMAKIGEDVSERLARLAARRAHSAPVIAALKPWLEARLAEDIRDTLAHWPDLIRFEQDGTLELDTNPVDHIAATLRAILDGHPQSGIDDLMPWRFNQPPSLAAQGKVVALTADR